MSTLSASRWLGGCLIGAALSGCSIHPSIDDVTRYDAADVVRKTRCEARDVLTRKLVAWMERLSGDPAAEQLAARIRGGMDVSAADFRPLRPETKNIIDRFSNSAIAYDFTLNMTETNSGSAALGTVRTVSNGTKTLGLSASSDRIRQNISTFLITDTFVGLLHDVDPKYCQNQNVVSRNYLYPITGNIGLAKTLNAFVDLSLFGELAGKDKGPPTMSDSLEFTTKWTASVNPSLQFSTADIGTRLASASLMAGASREDRHKVIIGMSTPVPAAGGLKATQTFTGQFVEAPAKATRAEVQAASAVAQHVLRFDIGQNREPATVVVQSLFPLF